ncbi:hypothetical protein FACS1894216_09910 [Synergistales bacterium]|nr:hypothetical protein FACS1894216_09910 [Synergistales bacterium]
MKKSFFSFQGKVFFILFLFMLAPSCVVWYGVNKVTKNALSEEKQGNLMSLAKILDASLGDRDYNDILRERGAENAAREEKIRVLNEELYKITDDVAASSHELGVGYYSRELDAIITYGPSSQYADMVGKPVAPDHKGRAAMNAGKPDVMTGTMARGNIMNAILPIERHGEVIGYIWANELQTDIEKNFRNITRTVSALMIISCALTMACMFVFTRRTVNDIDTLIHGVDSMKKDMSFRIKRMPGELGEVAGSINSMAAGISRAAEETNRAVSVLRGIMRNIDTAILVCDPSTKKIVYVNEYVGKFLKDGDVEGKLCYKVLYGRDDVCGDCPQANMFDGDSNPIFRDFRREVHNPIMGRDFLATDRLITWPDGRILHLELGADITERKALLHAEASNAAQKEFLARMSHELRTPMNGVLGMTRLAIQHSPPPKQFEYLEKIQSSATLLLGIINDILDFSKIEAGKIEIEHISFSIRAMVENIRELIMPRMDERNLELIIDIDGSVPEFGIGDKLRFSQILLNLIGNASKFTTEGSVTLTMSASLMETGDIRIGCEVRDTGIGMTEEQMSNMFKPFTQADNSTARKFGGTGLGLSISKALVILMGGEIGVKSELGKGSVFFFHIVLGQSFEAEKGFEALDENVGARRYDGCKFLLVEDNEINQEIASAILVDELGASIDIAKNGEEGVRFFLERDYALILMDIRMPVMDGIEATVMIRRSDKHDASAVPIIAMTANAMREDMEETAAVGMNGHISKPIDVNELKNAIFRVIGENEQGGHWPPV